MKQNTRHYLSGEMVLKESWSPEHQAITVAHAEGTQISLRLDSEEGDNVTTIPKGMSLSEDDGSQSCIGMKTICLYGEGEVQVSPSDEGNDFHDVPMNQLVPTAICARRVRIIGSGKIVLQAV